MQRDTGGEPTALKLRDILWKELLLTPKDQPAPSQEQQLWEAEGQAESFFRSWGEYPYYALYAQNPPFQSAAQQWYGLYDTDDQGFYQLVRFNAQGVQEQTRVARRQLCGDSAVGNPRSACGCRVVDVSEPSHTVLTYCRQQRGDFDGAVQKQWLSVFHSDDLTESGLIDLPKSSDTLQAIALHERQPYVVTLQFGEELNIYPISVRK